MDWIFFLKSLAALLSWFVLIDIRAANLMAEKVGSDEQVKRLSQMEMVAHFCAGFIGWMLLWIS